MRRNRLLDLYALNSGKGAGLRADANVIYLYDFIAGSESEAQFWGGISAEGFARQMAALEGDVLVRIDSPGGDVFGGRAIAQAIRDHKGKVTCQIDGLAASAASYIAISGDSVIAAPGSFMMIHRAWSLALGNCADLRATADLLEKIDGTIADSYAARSATAQADWLALMDAETWLTAGEAATYGLVDTVLPEQADKAASAQWDLSAFTAAPASFRETPADPPPSAPEPKPEPKPEPEPEPDIAARRRRLTVDLLLTRTA